MSNEKIKSSLSAMMDDAADELEIRRVLANTDEALLATWSRYQVARSVMRKEPVFPRLDIASAISEVIAKETEETKRNMSTRVKKTPVLKRSIGKFAVAASILAVTLSTVYFFGDGSSPDIVNNVYVSSDDSLGGTDVVLADPQVDKKVTELLEKHEKQGLVIEEEKALILQSKQ